MKVKPFEWVRVPKDAWDDPETRRATTPVHRQYYITFEQGDWWYGSTPYKTEDEAKAAAQSDFASRIRSCLLDKPEAGEGEPVEERREPWGIVRKGSDGDVAIFSTKFNSVKARFTAGNALKSGQMLYVHPHSPADKDTAQSGGETPVAFERLIERGQAFANQVRHVTYLLYGQPYSSTVSEPNAFDAALRHARAAIRQRAEEE